MKYFLIRTLILTVTVHVVTYAAFGQKAGSDSLWEQKPIAEWTHEDVKTIFQNSPWSRTIAGRPTHSSAQLGTVVSQSQAVFTLRSALVVRYAIIRAEQLKSNYDSMDAKAKAEFGKRFKAVLDCALCENSYIIAVTGDSELLTKAPFVKSRAKNIYLSNEKGERRELTNFSPQTIRGSEALFFFNRYDSNGKPLLTPDNETLTFNFRYESGDDPVISLIERVEFKVRDIVRENQVIF